MTDHTDKTKESFNLKKAVVTQYIATGVETVYFAVRPQWDSFVTINKNGSTATFRVTNDYKPDTPVDDAIFSNIEQSTGTDDYQRGHNAGMTGFELDITTYVSDVEIVISNYRPESL